MLNRKRIKSRTLLVLTGAGLAVALVVFASISRWGSAGNADLPAEMFRDDLADALKDEIAQGRQRIQRTPTAGSWGSLGELCMAHELLPQAEWCFRKAASLAPDDPQWIYLLAVIAEEVDLAQAVASYDKVLSLDPSVATVHYRRGRLLARVGRFEDAEQSLKTAADMSQQHPLVLKAMSQLCMMQGDGEGAKALIQQAVHDSRAGLDIVEEAERMLARQSQQNVTSTSPPPEVDSSRPLVTQPLPEPWLDGVVRRMPQTAEVAARAGTLATGRQFKAALEMYERLMRIDDRNSRAHTFHAMVLMDAGNGQQALDEMKRVCEEFPQDALAFSSRASIEARMGNFPAAIESLKEAVRLKPDFADAHRALLMIFQLQKMTTQVDAQFRTLLALVPGDQELQTQYKVFQRDQGQQPERK